MSFHKQRLRILRRRAGLGAPVRRREVVRYLVRQDEVPMPSFHVPGMRLPKDGESDYIDSKYFSPAALAWADAAAEYLDQDGVLDSDDKECFARVFKALRAGKRPTAAQQREFQRDVKWQRAFAGMPELYRLEMLSRGVRHYGPDDPLDDEMKGPGSDRELVYKYRYEELGYKTSDSASTAHIEWVKARGTA